MDPVLNRPLFRKKALHQEQVRQNKIPGFIIGGIVPIAAGIGRAALTGYRTFRGAQAARPAIGAGLGRLGQAKERVREIGQYGKKVFGTPTGQKLGVGAELGLAGAGLEETRRGVMGEESIYGDGPASVVGGLTSLYGGTGLVGRTLKGAFPKSLKAAAIGEKITKKTPFPIVASLLGVPAGMAESETRRAIKDESEKRIPEETLTALEKKLNELGEAPDVNQVINTVQNFKITDKQRQAVYDTLGISEFAKTQQQSPSPKGSGPQDGPVIPTQKTVKDNMMGVTEPILDTSKMDPAEKDDLAITMTEQMEKAKKQVADAEGSGDDSFKREFTSLKQQIQGATNNGDMTNLVLLKLASGLLTGKSRDRGVAGLFDVAGQALGPTVDTAIVLANQQAEFDQNLAIQLIKDRADRRSAGVVKAGSARQFLVESTPGDTLFPETGRYVPVNKDTGTYLDSVVTNQGEVLTEYTGNGVPEKADEKNKQVAFRQLGDLARGIEFTQIVQTAPLSTIGPEGRVREITDAFIGAGKGFMSSLGPIDEFKVKSFNDISEQIMNINPGDTPLSDDSLKDRIKDAEKMLSTFQKEDDKLSEKFSEALESGDQARIARAQLRLIEQRMKYVIANSNKGTDRLTVKDIESAAERTRIFDLLDNPEQIKRNYQAIEKDLNAQFKRNAGTYVRNGGSKDYILSKYRNLNPVQQYLLRQDQAAQEQVAGEKNPYGALKGL